MVRFRKTSQRVDAFLTEGFIALRPLSGFGLWRPEDGATPDFLEKDCHADELGKALLAGLHCSRIIPLEDVAFRSLEKQAESYKHSEDALLQRTGHKSKTRAYRNAIWCDISRGEGEIVFLPFRAAGRGTWKMLPEDECVIIPDTTDPEKLGSALWLAFNRGRDFEL